MLGFNRLRNKTLKRYAILFFSIIIISTVILALVLAIANTEFTFNDNSDDGDDGCEII
ncbi:MAG: hypothetical protein ACFFFB_13005 [Candidatus Heimdallarchaeota archaeon]